MLRGGSESDELQFAENFLAGVRGTVGVIFRDAIVDSNVDMNCIGGAEQAEYSGKDFGRKKEHDEG